MGSAGKVGVGAGFGGLFSDPPEFSGEPEIRDELFQKQSISVRWEISGVPDGKET